MELVPIVIEVLKIVSVLAVGTLLFSYVAFKIRQKSTPQKNGNNETDTNLGQNYINRSLKRITQLTKEIVLPRSTHTSRSKSSPPPKQRLQKKENPPPRSDLKEEPKPKRIEVIKNFQQKEEIKKEKIETVSQDQKANLNSLGNDVLDKYIDDENSNLFTLKTQKNQEKN
jgi:hypothetical protein